MAAVVPMPSASVRVETTVNAGVLRNCRHVKRTSRMVVSTPAPMRASRTCSFSGSMPPSSTSAARRAASGGIPRSRYRAAISSAAACSSSSRSRSSACCLKIDRHALVSRRRSRMSVGLQDEPDGAGDPGPVPLLDSELAAAGGRQPVELRAPPLCSRAPFTFKIAFLFEPMQRRKQRTSLDTEGAAGDLCDPVGDGDAMPRLELEGLENQEIERTFEEFGLLFRHRCAADYRTSISAAQLTSSGGP